MIGAKHRTETADSCTSLRKEEVEMRKYVIWYTHQDDNIGFASRADVISHRFDAPDTEAAIREGRKWWKEYAARTGASRYHFHGLSEIVMNHEDFFSDQD